MGVCCTRGSRARCARLGLCIVTGRGTVRSGARRNGGCVVAGDRVPTLVVPIPSRENATAKGMRLLIEGRVRVRLVHRGRVWCEVRGDSGRIHNVAFRNGAWSCSCEARGQGCSHMRAVWLVVAEGPEVA